MLQYDVTTSYNKTEQSFWGAEIEAVDSICKVVKITILIVENSRSNCFFAVNSQAVGCSTYHRHYPMQEETKLQAEDDLMSGVIDVIIGATEFNPAFVILRKS